MDKTQLVQITKDQNGRDLVMVRVDKTVKELMNEKPSSRWDPEYWHPKHTINFHRDFKLKQVGDFVEYITYGVILTGKDREFSKSGVYYISSTTVTETGINHHLNPLFVNVNDKRNKKTKKPRFGDIILNRSGVGTLGRQCVFCYLNDNWTISDDTDLIRLSNISPFYVSVFLKTKYGKSQIEQRMRGVSGLIKLNFEDIKAIKIPLVPDKIQQHIELQYKKMTDFHNKAMETKKKGDDNEYRTNLETAEKMLKDLIAKTEAVIRGERKDIV